MLIFELDSIIAWELMYIIPLEIVWYNREYTIKELYRYVQDIWKFMGAEQFWVLTLVKLHRNYLFFFYNIKMKIVAWKCQLSIEG